MSHHPTPSREAVLAALDRMIDEGVQVCSTASVCVADEIQRPPLRLVYGMAECRTPRCGRLVLVVLDGEAETDGRA